MEGLRAVLRPIVAGVFLLGFIVATGATSYYAGLNARCEIVTAENAAIFRDIGFDWKRPTSMCKVGDYQLYTPAEAGPDDSAYILRKGRPFLLVNEKETDLFDDAGEHFLFSLTRETPKRPRGISYSTNDKSKNARIENFDIGADGTLDYRTTEIAGRTVKQEFRVGEQWLEKVDRDGRPGVVFNGRFMPVSEAIKLADSTEQK
jgi:hypothetical protein